MSNIVERSDQIDEKLKKIPDLNKNIDDLVAYGRRNRKLIWLSWLSIIFDLILTLAVIYFANQSIISRNRIESTHISVVANCQAGNNFRKDNLKLWNYVLAVPSPTPRTEQQEQTRTDFRKFVNKTFELRDCSKIQ